MVYHGNHHKSLPARSGRQSDVRAASWIEVPTDLELAEARILLAKISSLNDRGLTAEAVVIDFVFKNIQPFMDRVYLAYLYIRANDPSRITNRQISEENVLRRVELMLRGRISNVGAPRSYFAWNLHPTVSADYT